MRNRLLNCLWVFTAAILGAPLWAMAQMDQPTDMYDARLETYPTNVTIPDATTSLTWLFLVFLTIVCLSVLFKDARRTHLD